VSGMHAEYRSMMSSMFDGHGNPIAREVAAARARLQQESLLAGSGASERLGGHRLGRPAEQREDTHEPSWMGRSNDAKSRRRSQVAVDGAPAQAGAAGGASAAEKKARRRSITGGGGPPGPPAK